MRYFQKILVKPIPYVYTKIMVLEINYEIFLDNSGRQTFFSQNRFSYVMIFFYLITI